MCQFIIVSISETWTENQTKWLLDKYAENMSEVGPKKRFRNKKCIWELLAEQMEAELKIKKSFEQLANRFKTVSRKAKNQIDHNNKSGNTRVDVDFEEELRKISSKDDSIEPEVLCGVNYVKRKNDENNVATTSAPKQKWKKINIKKPDIAQVIKDSLESLEKNRAEREKERERRQEARHQEKLDLIRSLFQQ